ncbi:MAG: PilZ domain-containing protein [Candidatus Omnitrophica bacterium]|nr:PilZ domain-containing protein [Candidatus Omnitrophota bacterium]
MLYSSRPCRRRHQRYEVDGQATLVTGDALQRPSILKDLSVIGAGIISNFPLQRESEVGILLRAASLLKSPLARKARVVWCKKLDDRYWQSGLSFNEDNKICFES